MIFITAGLISFYLSEKYKEQERILKYIGLGCFCIDIYLFGLIGLFPNEEFLGIPKAILLANGKIIELFYSLYWIPFVIFGLTVLYNMFKTTFEKIEWIAK